MQRPLPTMPVPKLDHLDPNNCHPWKSRSRSWAQASSKSGTPLLKWAPGQLCSSHKWWLLSSNDTRSSEYLCQSSRIQRQCCITSRGLHLPTFLLFPAFSAQHPTSLPLRSCPSNVSVTDPRWEGSHLFSHLLVRCLARIEPCCFSSFVSPFGCIIRKLLSPAHHMFGLFSLFGSDHVLQDFQHFIWVVSS